MDSGTVQISKEVNLFAKTNFRKSWRVFGIKTDDRRRHMYVIGKTGMGKSTMIENMVFQDIVAGHGLALVDPHGDTAEKMLEFIPSYRVNDVVYFNPSDVDHPIAFNVLEAVSTTHRHLIASGLIGVFKKIWIDSWGPRLEYVLRNTILALLEYEGSTLLGVTRILVDKKYRDKVVEKITDPVVKAFWIDEFNSYSNQFRTEAVSPIQNKVGQFLSSSIIRNIVGQPKSTIDMREIMDSGKILILNLAKGRIGEDNSALLGAMLITKMQLAAMSRIDIPEAQRRDFFLYVDEFQNFATESFANILSEARKYRLNLTVAHQYIEQLDERVQAAVFGNVGTLVAFRIGAADAETLVKEFEPVFTETDLVNLTKFDIYLKLMIDGVASEPFSATTLPPISQRQGNAEKVIAVSRERYAKDRITVEEKIVRWHGLDQERDVPTGERARGESPRFDRPRERRDDSRPRARTTPPAEALERVVSMPREQPISLQEAVVRKPQEFTRAPGGRSPDSHRRLGGRGAEPRRNEAVRRDDRPRRPQDSTSELAPNRPKVVREFSDETETAKPAPAAPQAPEAVESNRAELAPTPAPEHARPTIPPVSTPPSASPAPSTPPRFTAGHTLRPGEVAHPSQDR